MFANVVIDSPILEKEDFLVYRVPESMEGLIVVGQLVLVPMGKYQKRGIVLNIIKEKRQYPYTVKYIKKVISTEPLIRIRSIELAIKISQYYFAPLYKTMKLFLPRLIWSGDFSEKYENEYYFSRKKVVFSKQAKKQQNIYLDCLNTSSSCFSLKELQALKSYSVSALNALVDKGVFTLRKKVVYRDPLSVYKVSTEPIPKLNVKQSQVFHNIIQDSLAIHLVHGVTGSGKTEVYISLVDHMVRNGKSVIILIPEINLTPQNIVRFLRYFPENVAVWHSRLSDGEKFDEWKKINEGRASIVIGSRSALFAPVQNLGLVVIDEEHDQSFKQDISPRYHARKVASFMVAMNPGLKVVLGSATPSIETYYSARKGVIGLNEIPDRFGDVRLPDIKIVDLSKEKKSASAINYILYLEIAQILEKGEQAMLLLNKRGAHTGLQCFDCGKIIECHKCDIPFTVHLNKNIYMVCHYCRSEKPVPSKCPNCDGFLMRGVGYGIQSVELELKKAFPDARILRVDSDSMARKDDHRRVYEAFYKGEVDILLGTQMIAKGLDIPNVNLVGVILADIGLHSPDFRAEENIFQLMTQVSGRSGRREKQGKVIIQTFSPDSLAIKLAKAHNYPAFYEKTIEERKRYLYPPFRRLMKLIYTDFDENKALVEAERLSVVLKDRFPDITILGPGPDIYYKINNKYHFQILVKAVSHEDLKRIRKSIPSKWRINIDP